MQKTPQKVFELAITWNWEFDRDFVFQINDICVNSGLRPYLIHPFNLQETLQLLKQEQIKFCYLFDRASDTDHRFHDIIQFLEQKEVLFINHPEWMGWIDDKMLIHMEFILNDIPVPRTFIYYPTDDRRIIVNKIKQIGIPFVVKPAHGVEIGGAGVLVNARSVEDVCQWHSRYKNFIFLLQRQVNPYLMGERVSWFRVFYVLGKIIPCWWNPNTHIYEIVSKSDIDKFELAPLYELTQKISKIYKLGFFSTEIAVEKANHFVVVDYINDQCDMRRKSKYSDGVCDEVVSLIANRLVEKVKKDNRIRAEK